MRHMQTHQTLWATSAIMLVLALVLLPVTTAFASPDGRSDVHFSGVITALDTDAWIIAGHTVVITDARIRDAEIAAPGMWAEVMATRLPNGDLLASKVTVLPPEVRIKGPVTAKPVDGLGTWEIAGQPVEVTADTRISQRGSIVDLGYWVEVYALEVEGQDPPLTARRMRGIEPLTAAEIHGAIQSFSDANWMLSSVNIAVDDATLVNGQPAVGVLAHADADLSDEGDLLALRLKVFWLETGVGRTPVTLTGIVQSIPANGYTGKWLIDDTVVAVSPNTLINEDYGLAVVGAEAQVEGWQGTDKVVAEVITVLSGPDSGQPLQFTAAIESLPADGLIGTWVIGGYEVQVTQQTRLEGERYARLGAPADVKAVRRQNGETVATWLRIRAGKGPHTTLDLPTTLAPAPQ